MNFLALNDRASKVTVNSAQSAAGGGVDDFDAVVFCFCCVCHDGVFCVVLDGWAGSSKPHERPVPAASVTSQGYFNV